MGFNPVDILQKLSAIPGLYFLNTYSQKIWMVFSRVRDRKERAYELKDRVGAAGSAMGIKKGEKKKEGEGSGGGSRLRGKRSSGGSDVAASQQAGPTGGSGVGGSGASQTGSPWPDELPDSRPVRVSDDFGRLRGGKSGKKKLGDEPPPQSSPATPAKERLRKRHER